MPHLGRSLSAWHSPRAAPNALPAGLPSSQRYAPQRLPIGSCPTYGGQAAVQTGSDPQASPSATCQGAARKGWKSASSSHLTLRRNGASSGHAGTSAAPSLLGVLTQGCRCKKQRAERIASATSSASCPSSTYWGYGRIPASQRFLWLSDGCHYIASQATKTESDIAGARARAGQLIGQAARAAKSARARAPASWIDPSAVAFQIMLCGRRKEKCMAARARPPASWPIRVSWRVRV